MHTDTRKQELHSRQNNNYLFHHNIEGKERDQKIKQSSDNVKNKHKPVLPNFDSKFLNMSGDDTTIKTLGPSTVDQGNVEMKKSETHDENNKNHIAPITEGIYDIASKYHTGLLYRELPETDDKIITDENHGFFNLLSLTPKIFSELGPHQKEAYMTEFDTFWDNCQDLNEEEIIQLLDQSWKIPEMMKDNNHFYFETKPFE